MRMEYRKYKLSGKNVNGECIETYAHGAIVLKSSKSPITYNKENMVRYELKAMSNVCTILNEIKNVQTHALLHTFCNLLGL